MYQRTLDKKFNQITYIRLCGGLLHNNNNVDNNLNLCELFLEIKPGYVVSTCREAVNEYKSFDLIKKSFPNKFINCNCFQDYINKNTEEMFDYKKFQSEIEKENLENNFR